jgi:hypothetical protein
MTKKENRAAELIIANKEHQNDGKRIDTELAVIIL